jgi:predicted nucleic acid-binding protein
MILVDTNILLDIVTENASWADWSYRALSEARTRDALAINDIVYAEMSVGYERIEDVDTFLAQTGLAIERVPRPALFLAGRAYKEYRRSTGTKTGVLPDFFIGAHAAIEGAELLTRDPRRIRNYFPTVTLVSP